MIYGINIVLNDCNFSLKNRDQQVQERYAFKKYFTLKKSALKEYKTQVIKVQQEQSYTYSKGELRGICILYKCKINNGIIEDYGETIADYNF